jgi:hypothetical protein
MFNDEERDVLFYLISYCDVFGSAPSLDEIRAAFDPSVIDGLVQQEYLHRNGTYLRINAQKVRQALSDQLGE